jgi:hypothetical protein
MNPCSMASLLGIALCAAACGGHGGTAVGVCEEGDPACATSGSGTASRASLDGGSHDGSESGPGIDAGGALGETAGGSSTCVPGGACGGVFHCEDRCYSDKCCEILCDCTDPTGQAGDLSCGMYCP